MLGLFWRESLQSRKSKAVAQYRLSISSVFFQLDIQQLLLTFFNCQITVGFVSKNDTVLTIRFGHFFCWSGWVLVNFWAGNHPSNLATLITHQKCTLTQSHLSQTAHGQFSLRLNCQIQTKLSKCPSCGVSHVNTVSYGLSERKQVGENRICISILHTCIRS